MKKQLKKQLKKELNSFKHALNGLKLGLNESHIIVHLIIVLMVVILGIYKELTTTKWMFIILCIVLVISLELINTAIEKTVDYISLKQKPIAKAIKDISAGAVLIASIGSAIIGCIILFF